MAFIKRLIFLYIFQYYYYQINLIKYITERDVMVKSPSSISMQRNISSNDLQNPDAYKVNTHFFKKIPPGAEASNILVGEVDFLDKTLSAFIRLNEGAIMGDLTEVPVPTRYVFLKKKMHLIGW